jgi:L-malate glycosyltransferase
VVRVLQVVQQPQRRGAEIFAHQLSRWLRVAGHATCSAYLYPHHGSKSLQLGPDDVLLDGRERHPLEKVPGLHPRLLLRLREVVRRFEPDIIQVNGARTVKYGAGLRALSQDAPWKIVYRNIDSPAFWVKGLARKVFYKRFVMSRIDGVIGVSQRTLAEVKELYGLAVPSIHIPNGVDLEALRPACDRRTVRNALETPEDAVVAIFIGSLSRQKRPDRFLQVIATAARAAEPLFAWLLGDGPNRDALEAQARTLGVEARVRFLGYQEEVASYIAAADLFVSTSDTEGIPAVVAEAGYLGLPTLGLRVGGMSECVIEGKTGHLYAPSELDALVTGIVELVNDADSRGRLGRSARDWTAENYSMERVGAEYLRFYRRVLGSR